MGGEGAAVIVARVGAPAVAVMHESSGDGVTATYGAVQRRERQLGVVALAHRPADDTAREEVEEPARYAQPSSVATYVTSPAQTWFGELARSRGQRCSARSGSRGSSRSFAESAASGER